MKPAIADYVLFNHINQSNPILFVDFREESAFQARRFRNSHNLKIEVCDGDGLIGALSHVSKRNKFMLVFVVDGSVDLAALEKLVTSCEKSVTAASTAENKEPSTQLAWSNFTSVEHVQFDTFFDNYPTCTSLYEGSNYPGKRIFKHYSSEIVPNFLYLGSYYDATDEVIMTEMRITHIVDATGSFMSQQTSEKLGITYLHIPVWDMEGVDISQYFTTVLEFVHAARAAEGRVLIHCRAGISRSSTLVLVYLMHSGHVRSLQEAVKLVVTERPYVLPNPSFRDQLRDYEGSLFGTRSFATDKEMLSFISTINFCWSGIFSAETDHDRVPIIAASRSINSERLKDMYATPEAEALVNAKPKKPFLKRALKVSACGAGSAGGEGGSDITAAGDADCGVSASVSTTGSVGTVPVPRAKPSFVRPQVGRVKKSADIECVIVVGGKNSSDGLCGSSDDISSSGVTESKSSLDLSDIVSGAAGTGACAVKALRSPVVNHKSLTTTHTTHTARATPHSSSTGGELVHSVVRKVIGTVLPPTPPVDTDQGMLLRDWRLFETNPAKGVHGTEHSGGLKSPVDGLPPARLM